MSRAQLSCSPLHVSPVPRAGTLSFTVGHSEYNSLGLGNQEECDLILESVATNISLCHRKVSSSLQRTMFNELTFPQVIPPWVTSSENVVELSDDGGWEHTETSEARLARNCVLCAMSRQLTLCSLHPAWPSCAACHLCPPFTSVARITLAMSTLTSRTCH